LDEHSGNEIFTLKRNKIETVHKIYG
jgi:hypothetical protein